MHSTMLRYVACYTQQGVEASIRSQPTGSWEMHIIWPVLLVVVSGYKRAGSVSGLDPAVAYYRAVPFL